MQPPPQTSLPRTRPRRFGAREQALLLACGLVLFVLLLTFRVNYNANDSNHYQGWLVGALWFRVATDAALVALIEVGLGLPGLVSRGRGLRLWRACVVLTHLFLGAVELCSEQYFMASGQRLRPTYAFFVIFHPPGHLGGIIDANIDVFFKARVAAAVLSFSLAFWLTRGVLRMPGFWRPRPIGLAVTAASIVLLLLPAPERRATNGVGVSMLGGFLHALEPTGLFQQHLNHTLVHYTPPRVVEPAPPGAPNILIVALESSRPDLIRPYPDGRPPPMPYLAGLAAKGLDVLDVAAGVNHTTKALITLFCGMFPPLNMEALGGLGTPKPLTCLPDVLNAAGYHTAYFQGAFGAIEDRTTLIHDMGFQHQTMGDELQGHGFLPAGYLGVDEFAMLDPVSEWIRDTPKPFFIGMLTVSTHHPYAAPGDPGPTSISDRHVSYLRAAAHVDRFLKALMDRLEQAHVLDDTIVIFVGDHGESFGDGEHVDFGGHDACPFDECMRVPYVMYGPRWLGAPRKIGGLRHEIDILPTILNLTGTKWAGDVPGLDMLKTGGHDAVFSSCYWTRTCLVEQSGGLATIYAFEDRPLEIYNLLTDPHETNDLAPVYPEGFREERVSALLSFQESVNYYYANVKTP